MSASTEIQDELGSKLNHEPPATAPRSDLPRGAGWNRARHTTVSCLTRISEDGRGQITMSSQGKTAIVTGASHGIGAGI